MKTTLRLLTFALLLLAGFSAFITLRMRQLEARLAKVERAQRTGARLSYAFDDSFLQHFGQQGVHAVDRVMRHGATDPADIIHDATRELRLQ